MPLVSSESKVEAHSEAFSSSSISVMPAVADCLLWAVMLGTEGLFSSPSSLSSGRSFSSAAVALGWKGAMALRMQLTHCCLWKTSLACSVWDWPGEGSWKRTLKIFLAGGKQRGKKADQVLAQYLEIPSLDKWPGLPCCALGKRVQNSQKNKKPKS